MNEDIFYHWTEFSQDLYLSRDTPSELFLARGMLSLGEVRALFTAASNFFRNRGKIIDAGAFAGMSAHSFAVGLQHNALINDFDEQIIHSYDKFKADEPSVLEFLRNVFYTQRSAKGIVKEAFYTPARHEDFLHVFWHQNQRHAKLIVAHQGDFAEQKWDEPPIEILFVDVCKTRELQNHLLSEFMPHMIEGESILIQQDYNHLWHPYIHLAMEVLDPCFDILVRGEGASRFYFFKKAPSQRLLSEAVKLDLDALQIGEAFHSVCAKSEPRFVLTLKGAHVKALMDFGFTDEAEKRVHELKLEYKSHPGRDRFFNDIDKVLQR